MKAKPVYWKRYNRLSFVMSRPEKLAKSRVVIAKIGALIANISWLGVQKLRVDDGSRATEGGSIMVYDVL